VRNNEYSNHCGSGKFFAWRSEPVICCPRPEALMVAAKTASGQKQSVRAVCFAPEADVWTEF